jgi:hypothetical protein
MELWWAEAQGNWHLPKAAAETLGTSNFFHASPSWEYCRINAQFPPERLLAMDFSWNSRYSPA